MLTFRLPVNGLPSRPNLSIPDSRVNHPKISPPLHRSPVSGQDTNFADTLNSLRICAENEDPTPFSCHHARILKLGIESDAFVSNSLLNGYSKCDRIKDAEKVFDQMPHRTIVSWTSMMSAYCRVGEAYEAVLLFSTMLGYLHPNEYTLAVALQAAALMGDEDLVKAIHCHAIKGGFMSDEFLVNCLIDAYAKSGAFGAAEMLCSRDVVAWTSVISGCVCRGNVERAMAVFCNMQEDGISPNDVTMISVLQACEKINDFRVMQWVHGLILKGNWCANCLVMNSLIRIYTTNGRFAESMMIFCGFGFCNDGLYLSSETMASLLQGCANYVLVMLGRVMHGYLVKHGFLPCVVGENSLINMYAKSGMVDSALLVFRKMEVRDVISWNSIISGLVKNGAGDAALRVFLELYRGGYRENVSPDFVTVLAVLESCSELALLLQGELIHGYLVKTGMIGDVFIQNGLIDVYAKSGRVDFAENVYTEMSERDIGTFNSIIAAYGTNGNAVSALKALSDIETSSTLKPNAITFVNALTACSHAALVQEGFKVFNSMEGQYGVEPSMEHYACMVDLLGRAGKVEDAERFIHSMPLNPGPDVWGALLSACVATENTEIAERAARELADLQPNSSIWRVALSNVYARTGKWDKVAEMRAELRRGKQLKKEKGWSSVSIQGSEFRFVAGDTQKPESCVVYEMITCLHNNMRVGSVSDSLELVFS